MGKLSRGTLKLPLIALLLCITWESSPAYAASTKIRLGSNTNFLDRVHKDDLNHPGLAWRDTITRLLDRLGPNWKGSSQSTESRLSTLDQGGDDANVLRIHNEAAADRGSLLRQMEEERRIAGLGKGSGIDVARQHGSGQARITGEHMPFL